MHLEVMSKTIRLIKLSDSSVISSTLEAVGIGSLTPRDVNIHNTSFLYLYHNTHYVHYQ